MPLLWLFRLYEYATNTYKTGTEMLLKVAKHNNFPYIFAKVPNLSKCGKIFSCGFLVVILALFSHLSVRHSKDSKQLTKIYKLS